MEVTVGNFKRGLLQVIKILPCNFNPVTAIWHSASVNWANDFSS
jgi:hypothetical protein